MGTASVSGEPIRLEAPSRRDAVLLAEALGSLGAEVRKLDSHWEVVIPPDHQAAELLIEGFDAAGRWLVDRKLSSCRVSFGDHTYVVLQPTDERLPDSVEVLLERTIQLQMALETRIVIEQAKGVLAERLRIDVERAFQILRRAARSNGRSIHAIAAAVVTTRETPPEIELAARALVDEKSPA